MTHHPRHKVGDRVWVFIDPRFLAQEEVPVFECYVDQVSILEEITRQPGSKVSIKYMVSTIDTVDDPMWVKADRVFASRAEAIRYGAELTASRATEAEAKALRLRRIADFMDISGG